MRKNTNRKGGEQELKRKVSKRDIKRKERDNVRIYARCRQQSVQVVLCPVPFPFFYEIVHSSLATYIRR